MLYHIRAWLINERRESDEEIIRGIKMNQWHQITFLFDPLFLRSFEEGPRSVKKVCQLLKV